MSLMRVLIADDHPAVREGLRRMLERDNEIEVIGGAASGEEVVIQAQRLSPDVVLMDIKMPGMSGIEAIRKLKKKKPALNIVVLTAYENEEYVSEAIEAGAIGYLLKDIDPEGLWRAVREAHEGQSPLAPSVSRALLTYLATLSEDKTTNLSERQLKILKLITTGATNKEIAAQLFVSYATVKRELNSIFAELNVSSRAEAVAAAYERKLV